MQDLGFLSWKMEKKMPAIAFIDSDLESLCFFEIYINKYIYIIIYTYNYIKENRSYNPLLVL